MHVIIFVDNIHKFNTVNSTISFRIENKTKSALDHSRDSDWCIVPCTFHPVNLVHVSLHICMRKVTL